MKNLKKVIDKTGRQLKDGDIIDIGQTINGYRIFTIVIEDGKVKAYYTNSKEKQEYEYDIKELLEVDVSIDFKDIRIVGTIRRPICVCGEEMVVVQFTGYYDEFKYFECENPDCVMDIDMMNPTSETRGGYA